MASNDSGVETSNDSYDGSLIIPLQLEPLHICPSYSCTLPSNFDEIQEDHRVHRTSKMRSKCKQRWSIKSSYSKIFVTIKERRLRQAASTCNIDLLTRLLESGTNPNCADEHKRSPLHLAACRGYTTIVSELLRFRANPNVVDSLGNTPLHLAVISASSNNFNVVVRILLQGGASVHVLDRNGKNPMELAESKLRMMRARYKNPTPETSKILEDMCLLIANILRQFCKEQKELEDIDALEKRLQNLSTENQVVSEADTLLASIERLSIK